MSTRPDLAGVLAEHYAVGGYAPRAGWATDADKTGLWGCSCGASGPVLRGERVITHHRAHLAAALNAAIDAWLADEGTREAVVWQVSAFGRGRSVDRLCASLATGQSVCDDFMKQLGGDWVVVEDWANLNVPAAPERWVRYVSRNGGDAVEQIVAAAVVDTSGTWFREKSRAALAALTNPTTTEPEEGKR